MINASERVKGTLGNAGSFMKYVCSYDVRDSTSSGHKTAYKSSISTISEQSENSSSIKSGNSFFLVVSENVKFG